MRASSGMYSCSNLKELSKGAGRYVLATPVGRIKEIKDEVLSHPGHYADIALGYKGMWIIESCFHKMTTTGLEVRLMFHWMPQRITAHVKLCVLSLMNQ